MSTDKKSTLSTHVLDTQNGLPAQGISVTLEKQIKGEEYQIITTLLTNADGRGRDFPELENGLYRITFKTEEYFVSQNIKEYFFPKASIDFIVNSTRHYHVPLLLSPFGYSTYRGS
ncbi:hypothetical protein DFA_09192 [Cavenderia fasciculata]|uniref:5-hydroxyisourate hydrolase n=1 Tax=Cavenderia fasciculata TaxID=261658 RepID=F4Q6Y3_CACFS|nr:uncharacterized protein DFA_09192 [Cavenderia fasciculata]EGG16165.1 hypothetical protein DFA_09192 [Cavenderia fasciculata]|eukprot:XP_004352618.1 hypothetical protein DFA_09192 [Cavenderia fasciculata]